MGWHDRDTSVLDHRSLWLLVRVEVDRPPQANTLGLARSPDRSHRAGNRRLPVHSLGEPIYKTKGEVVAATVERHEPVIEDTVSCWKASRVNGDMKHCGYCVPCLSRRIALESHGLRLSEYQRDLLNEGVSDLNPSDEGKCNLVDLIEFVSRFSQPYSRAELEMEYSELVNEEIDSPSAIEMYQRFAQESLRVFDSYPSVRAIVS